VRAKFWNRHRILIAAAAMSTLLGTYTNALQALEGGVYDLAARVLPAAGGHGAVAVLAIDAPTLARMGPWPWSRDRIARILDRLRLARPRAIGLTLPLTTAQTPAGLAALRERAARLPAAAGREAGALLARLDTDAALAAAIRTAARVVLAAPARPAGGPQPPFPPSLEHAAIRARDLLPPPDPAILRPLLAPPPTRPPHVQAPIPVLADAAAGIGFLEAYPHRVRGLPLTVAVDGRTLPAFALRLAVLAAGVDARAITPLPGRGVRAGPLRWDTGPGGRWYPRIGRGYRAHGEPPVYSLGRWWSGDLPAARLHGRTVLIGLTAPGLAPELAGPAGVAFTPVTWAAASVRSLLAGDAVHVPHWFYGAQRGIVLALALWLAFLPSRLRGRAGLWLAAALALLLVNTELLALLTRSLWLPLTVPALFLVATQGLVAVRHRSGRRLAAADARAQAAHCALAAQYHAQGRLDEAFELLRGWPPDEPVREALYRLGQEYERRRQYPGALAVYAHLQALAPHYRDAAERHRRLARMTERFPAAAEAPGAAGGTLVLHDPDVERPMLGRYRLERELGRGSMGMVYLGADPKISRPVAIKTLPRTAADGSGAAESEQRFLREARAAGRLQHPNIVTIYDVGEEHDLAYIAMDYVEGEDLGRYAVPGRLLPVWEVLEIGAQVADALDYAHRNGVVHRDIKPGNILYQRETGTVKVTDFGIASLADGTRTRTGTVLGTPTYMSPEQVAGRRVEGPSDQFSLGVTLYQLLCGEAPFRADSIATLMYRIGNERHVDVRKRRKGVPACAARVLNTALRKDPKERFAGAGEMAAALRRCRARVRGGRRPAAAATRD